MHIHPSSPNSDLSFHSEESAAIRIQAGFRGYRVRKQLSCEKKSRNSQNTVHRRQWRDRPTMSHPQSSIESGITSASTKICDNRMTREAESVEDRCATKIQASVRGFLVRKKQKKTTEAATKIQAGFRGFKARKESQMLREQ
ncbi:abnormal spindle-like microcephaly-associated protein homolog [Stomoxys calcitrans]|uniref:Abnormal spindle-like microcephaly-associated protein homolog n=1 Tax=Stomoxys calcitrans TaxID=35570 RepID=A0A1I8PKK9_STOCA|nr:abnormal spindle-like microcephaly-associated protein homolog [Stomoxys calcitrans]